jgi:hypothetical protein
MLTWPTLDDWCYKVCTELHASAQNYEGKAVGLYRDLQVAGRPVAISERVFQNALTPTTFTHQLKLEEFWHSLDFMQSRGATHAIGRQLNLLVARVPVRPSSQQSALFGAFATRNREMAETQQLLKSIIDREKPFPTLKDRESLLREIYEDFCESLALLITLEHTCLVTEKADVQIATAPWEGRYNDIERGVVSALEALAKNDQCSDILSNRVIQSALNSKGPLRLSLPNFMKLLFLDKSRGLTKQFMASIGYRVSPLPTLEWRLSKDNMIRSYAHLESRQAGTAEKISDALNDQEISPAELSEIYQELVDEHQAQVNLIMSVGLLEPQSSDGTIE